MSMVELKMKMKMVYQESRVNLRNSAMYLLDQSQVYICIFVISTFIQILYLNKDIKILHMGIFIYFMCGLTCIFLSNIIL